MCSSAATHSLENLLRQEHALSYAHFHVLGKHICNQTRMLHCSQQTRRSVQRPSWHIISSQARFICVGFDWEAAQSPPLLSSLHSGAQPRHTKCMFACSMVPTVIILGLGLLRSTRSTRMLLLEAQVSRINPAVQCRAKQGRWSSGPSLAYGWQMGPLMDARPGVAASTL